MAELAEEAGVARATVFNHFGSKVALVEAITDDVMAYWAGMLERALADTKTPTPRLVRALFEADPGFEAGFDGETLGMLQQAFSAPAGETRSAEEKQVALRAAVRVAVAHNIVAVENSMAWRAYKTMSAALASGDAVPGGDEIRTLLGEIEDRYVDRMSALYAQLNAAVGIRMRDGVTEGDLALAIMSVIDGMADHRRINPPFVDRARRVEMGPEGPMDWHLAGLAVYGVYAAFTEERDDETATAGEEP